MRLFSFFLLCLWFFPLGAEEGRLELFYDEFVCETKAELAPFGLTTECSHTPIPPPPPPGPPPPPPGPPPPPPPPGPSPANLPGFIPFSFAKVPSDSFINNDEIYIVTKGVNPVGGTNACLIQLSPTGVGSCVNTTAGTTSSLNWTYPLSSLPTAPDGTPYVYMPPITSARIYFSLGTTINMTVNSEGVNDPNPASTSDVNYYILYDKVELNLEENQLAINPTMVDFFSLPLPISVYTNNGCALLNVGMPPTQNREQVFTDFISTVAASIPNASAAQQWSNLVLTGTSEAYLRLLSSGEAMHPSDVSPLFDPQYLSATAYGLNWMDNVWSNAGITAFYQANTVYMDLSEVPGYDTWSGTVSATGWFNFQGTGGDGAVIIQRPADAVPFFVGTSFSATGDPIASPIIQRFLGAGFASGIVPATGPLSDAYLIAHQPYYQNNPNIVGATTTGPWYDFYSKELHSLGNAEYQFFTYPYDDSLGYNNLITINNIILTPVQVVITLGDMTGTTIP